MNETLYQPIVIFTTPLVEELTDDLKVQKKILKLVKEKDLSNNIPIHSQKVFPTEQQAIEYFPTFIRTLIEAEILTSDLYDEDKDGNISLKNDHIKTAVQPLDVTQMI